MNTGQTARYCPGTTPWKYTSGTCRLIANRSPTFSQWHRIRPSIPIPKQPVPTKAVVVRRMWCRGDRREVLGDTRGLKMPWGPTNGTRSPWKSNPRSRRSRGSRSPKAAAWLFSQAKVVSRTSGHDPLRVCPLTLQSSPRSPACLHGVRTQESSDTYKSTSQKTTLISNVCFTCKRDWRGPGPARAVTVAIVRCKRLLGCRLAKSS